MIIPPSTNGVRSGIEDWRNKTLTRSDDIVKNLINRRTVSKFVVCRKQEHPADCNAGTGHASRTMSVWMTAGDRCLYHLSESFVGIIRQDRSLPIETSNWRNIAEDHGIVENNVNVSFQQCTYPWTGLNVCLFSIREDRSRVACDNSGQSVND